MVAPQPVPDDVRAEIAGPDALDAVVAQARADSYVPSALGEPRTVHTWSDAFLAGDVSGDVLEALPEWEAPVLVGTYPAAVATFVREDDAVVLAGLQHDPNLAAEVVGLGDDVALVSYSGWDFLVDDAGVSAFSPGARFVLDGPGPVTLAEASTAMARDPGESSALPVIGGLLVVVALLVAPVVALVAWRSRRARQG
ncbi:hypothetical protein [Miniimonas arenae]|uniref:hypothetical protein n=1 Tax=Miniimonas arenae TaxID=676201 RepID=UPI0028A995A9|nr:hypothetical protein [Miniimonas arenae]